MFGAFLGFIVLKPHELYKPDNHKKREA